MTAELLNQLLAELADELASRIEAKLVSRQEPYAPAAEPWRLVKLDEAAARLGRSTRWVRERAKNGKLPHIRLDGGALAFDVDDLRAFAQGKRVPGDGDDLPAARRRLKAVGEEWWKE